MGARSRTGAAALMCMAVVSFCLLAGSAIGANPLTPGDHARSFDAGGVKRDYLVHVPPGAAPAEGLPVVLAFHGFGMKATMMPTLSNMNAKADQAGFVAVYPEGTGSGIVRVFNASTLKGALAKSLPDDVAMTSLLLDDLSSVISVNARRVYACGMSNGGMMCYRLAAELSNRIAAVASVAGTMSRELKSPPLPTPVIHIHGTADGVVPVDGPPPATAESFDFVSVDETMRFWIRANGCDTTPHVTRYPDSHDDGTRAERVEYRNAAGESLVVLIRVDGGGHTWPGGNAPALLGICSKDISATDIIWEFFQQHGRGE